MHQFNVKFWVVQGVVVLAFGISFAWGTVSTGSPAALSLGRETASAVHVERDKPLRVGPLYDDPELVSDEELAAVLRQVRPKFAPKNLKPNFVEHALRIWGIDARFAEKDVLSGTQMRDFLIDHGRYLASWGASAEPLLVDAGPGVAIRWGMQEPGGSVHHDHWLACLTEAGVPLNENVFTPGHRIKSIDDALQQALRDFHADERETEWSALAFGLWLPPQKSWQNAEGRQMSFDMLAQRLLRGALRFGVCSGTHRVYSMMLLVRLDDEHHILSPDIRAEILAHLKHVRDLIVASQFPDGHWPSNWYDGADAVKKPVDDALSRRVIATGHHLEWLAIAPEELHPPREQIRKAAKWAITTTVAQTPEQIQQFYTFFSHVGNALALWRHTRPADFWHAWEREHPQAPSKEPAVQSPPKESKEAH